MFGSVALYVPYKNAKSGEFTALITAWLVSSSLYIVWYFLLGKIFSLSKEKLLFKAAIPLLIAASLTVNTVTAKNFTDYIADEVLMKGLRILILIAFAAVCVYVATRSEETLLKLSLLAFAFVTISVIFLLLISFENFKTTELKTLFCGSSGDILKRFWLYFIRVFVFSLAFAIFSRLIFNDSCPKGDIIGLVIGGILIGVCFLSAVLTFSLSLASDIEYSYPMSISVVNVGELFTRMDGFAYFIFFFSALVKSAVCIKTVNILVNRAGIKKATQKTVLLAMLSFAISFIL